MKKTWLDFTVLVLIIVGALNWGLTALGYNVVDMLLGGFAMYAYYLVGLAGLYEIYFATRHYW
ncbi:MAG: DUF378 domain-containing protein [Candidatus Woesearchaeota archaeon]|jgi:hypothetical protein